MRDYQRQRRNPYLLPHNVYKQVLYMAKDYDRLRAEREDILCAMPIHDGMPRTTDPADQTYSKAERLSRIEDQIRAIERAVEKIPEEYRRGVWNNVLYGMPYPIIAGSATWQRWRSRYIWYVAKNAGLA
ncbi:hypothetical protein ACS3UN_09985 [Oscillospiraceae bacterium LTW-04]